MSILLWSNSAVLLIHSCPGGGLAAKYGRGDILVGRSFAAHLGGFTGLANELGDVSTGAASVRDGGQRTNGSVLERCRHSTRFEWRGRLTAKFGANAGWRWEHGFGLFLRQRKRHDSHGDVVVSVFGSFSLEVYCW